MGKHQSESIDTYIDTLRMEFAKRMDRDIAMSQEKYMRNKFSFIGMKSPKRREVTKPFLLKTYLPLKSDMERIVKRLWVDEYRDYSYFAMDLMAKYLKQTEKPDISCYEWLITTGSWWDTVDFLASTMVGNYFLKFPDGRDDIIAKWLDSDNIWLQRSTLIYQLKYKDKVDLEVLSHCIERLTGTKEFFINKAIGWSLRSYSRVDKDWVIDFVNTHDLSHLSKREALKLVGK